ncbi:MAG: hypothetical protein KDA77_00065 [Planctomycetaceae bacterium]|nr:hypothetical protein [Planctomycetaceae bacterium]
MMKKELQEATRGNIIAARKAGDRTEDPRELWMKIYGDKAPTIEDFADCYRSVLDEEKQQDEESNKPVKESDTKEKSK